MIVISHHVYTTPGSVSPGQQVSIVNNDDEAHTVTTDDNTIDVRVSGGGGISMFNAPSRPGTYPLHCRYHADMHGTLTVQ
jgi:plastocyanin